MESFQTSSNYSSSKLELEKEELERLYEEAQKEFQNSNEELIIWAGGDAPNQQDDLVEQFRKRFPNIPINLTVDLSKYHNIKVYQNLLDGNLTPDVVMLQTLNDFENWKSMGVLESFKPQSFSNLKSGYGDEDGYFLPVMMFTFVPQYKKGISKVPTEYNDFLDDEFKNHLVLTPPHDDDAVLFVYDKILQKHGLEFLKKLAKQNPTFVRGTAAPAVLVGKKEFTGNITGYFAGKNDPIESFIPKEDFFVSWAQRACMFKITKHRAAAKLWLAYLTSYEHQSSRGTWSVRKDVETPTGLSPIEKYNNTNPLEFIKWMRDREHLHNLRLLMEEIFGPVTGESPLTDYELLKLYK